MANGAAQGLLCRSCGPVSLPQPVDNSPPVQWHITAIYFWSDPEEERFSSVCKTIMLRRQNSSPSTVFRCNTWSIDLVQYVMNYMMTFELDYSVQFLQARAINIICYMQSFRAVQDAILSTFCRYSRVIKLILEIKNVFTFLYSRSSEVAEGMI